MSMYDFSETLPVKISNLFMLFLHLHLRGIYLSLNQSPTVGH